MSGASVHRANGRDERFHRPKVRLMPIEEMPYGGTIKWFDPDRRYGFVTPDSGHHDVFLHDSVVRLYGLRHDTLIKGARVRYAAEECAGKRPEVTAIAIA